jgi:thiol-disulfide isomerase/thioredoxin
MMIECFATWCPPCKAAIPHLAEMHAKYTNVYIVSISRETQEKVEALKKNMPMMSKYNLAVDKTGALEEYMEEQGVEGIPHAFIFNKDGELVW